MSICMRCGTNCTCHRHGKVPEELFYICTSRLRYPIDHKGKCMEHIRQVLDDHCGDKIEYPDRAIKRFLVLAVKHCPSSHPDFKEILELCKKMERK